MIMFVEDLVDLYQLSFGCNSYKDSIPSASQNVKMPVELIIPKEYTPGELFPVNVPLVWAQSSINQSKFICNSLTQLNYDRVYIES